MDYNSRLRSKFQNSVGIVGFGVAKRASTCALCNSSVPRGDSRFDFATHVQKPSKALHAGCIALIPDNLRDPSCIWLEGQLSTAERPEFERDVFQQALYDLRALQGLA